MKKHFLLGLLLSLLTCSNAQSNFPSDSIKKFDSIRAVAFSFGKGIEGKNKYQEAESVLERTFIANKKLTLTIRYSTLYNVMDDSNQNFYVTFMENGKLVILWFHRAAEHLKCDVASHNALISQIEKAKENDLLELDIEIVPGGSGNPNAYVPKRTTYAYKEDSKFFLHAKLIAVNQN